MFFRLNVHAFVALYILLVNGQGPPAVLVGLEGSFYTPGTISAELNDTIVFEFVGDMHTVTQSTFDDPCTPLPGGFNSGFAGKGTNSSAPTPVWNLVVTNVSAPIWYFCARTEPTFHCSVGMVGVINPPSIEMYNQFVNAAKLVTTTPAVNPTPILIGQGAFATNVPTPSILSSPSSTISSTLSTSSVTSTPTTESHLGAIIGGAIGGGVVLVCIIIVLWVFLVRRKNAPKRPESDEFFRYDPVPVRRRPSEVFAEAKRAESLHHNTSITSNSITSNPYIDESIMPTAYLGPVRRSPSLIVLQPPSDLHRQVSDLGPLSATTRSTFLGQTNNVDIRALAQEVAAVLYQHPPVPPPRHPRYQNLPGRQQMTVRNLNPEGFDYAGISHAIQPPPNYRAATGYPPVPRGKKKARVT